MHLSLQLRSARFARVPAGRIVRISLSAVLLNCTALLSGCSILMPSVPALPVATAPTKTDNDTTQAESRYKVGGTALSAITDDTTLPFEKSVAGVLAQVRAHEVLWRKQADELDNAGDYTNNTQFGGVVVSALGIVFNTVRTTKVGAGIAGATTVFSDRYQLATQAHNYRAAADAMQCIYKNVASLPSSFWPSVYDSQTGGLIAKRVDVVGSFRAKIKAESDAKHEERVAQLSQDAQSASNAMDSLSAIWMKIFESVSTVRNRLAAAQRAVKLAVPSSTDLANAIQQKANAKPSTNQQATLIAQNTTGVDAQAAAQALSLPDDLDACVALIAAQ